MKNARLKSLEASDERQYMLHENYEVYEKHGAPTGAITMHYHNFYEIIYVLEGVVEIDYGKHKYLLGTGDSIHYDCIVKHHVHAAGDKAAKILAVVYVPF